MASAGHTSLGFHLHLPRAASTPCEAVCGVLGGASWGSGSICEGVFVVPVRFSQSCVQVCPGLARNVS